MNHLISYEDKVIGNLTIDLKALRVNDNIDWEKAWIFNEADPYLFSDKICEIFDVFYRDYWIEHDFEPLVYAEDLGNFKVSLQDKDSHYLLFFNLDDESIIIEEQALTI